MLILSDTNTGEDIHYDVWHGTSDNLKLTEFIYGDIPEFDSGGRWICLMKGLM